MIRTVLATAAIVIGITAVAAQSEPIIKQRNSLMASMWKDGFASPYRMMKEREPFDPQKAEAGFAKMEEIVVQLPPLWPPNSKPPKNPNAKYSSSLKIWDNKPDFEAKLAKLTQSIKESRGKAKDLDSLKTIVTNINQNCDSCHEAYQVRNQ
jgi:cytochrome c556